MVIERRRSIRRRVCIKATVITKSGSPHAAVIMDISVGGCCLAMPFQGLMLGDEVSIIARMNDRPFELCGRVTHIYPPTRHARIGIEFYKTCLDSYRALVRLIYSDEAAHIAILARAQANKKPKH